MNGENEAEIKKIRIILNDLNKRIKSLEAFNAAIWLVILFTVLKKLVDWFS